MTYREIIYRTGAASEEAESTASSPMARLHEDHNPDLAYASGQYQCYRAVPNIISLTLRGDRVCNSDPLTNPGSALAHRADGEGLGTSHVSAVRAANRHTGASLATITERCSCSTVGSYIPISNSNPRPVNTLMDSIIEIGSSPSAARSTGPLQRHPSGTIIRQKRTTDDDHYAYDAPNPRTSTSGAEANAAATRKTKPPRYVSPGAVTANTEQQAEGKSLKGVWRGFMQHIRDSSRNNLPLADVTNMPYAAHDRGPSAAEERWSGSLQYGSKIPLREPTALACRESNGPISSLPPWHIPCHKHGKDCPRGYAATSKASVHDFHAGTTTFSLAPEKGTHSDLIPAPLWLSSARSQISSRNNSSSGTPSCGNVLKKDAVCETPTLSTRGRDDSSFRYTLDGVPVHRSNAPSLYEYDRARSTSFCSTVSTSYSGTVLGIDLDLQQDDVGVRSSPEQEHPMSDLTSATKDSPRRSITSSALPILLPLAASQGIVRADHTAPQISFFSPSGNLIKPAESSPASSTSYKDHTVTTHLKPQPLARPVLLPATSPPKISVPRHVHQGHHQHARSHIVPQSILPSTVKGCGGMVRVDSVQPCSGARRTVSSPRLKPPGDGAGDECSSKDTLRWRAAASCTSIPRTREEGSLRRRKDQASALAGWAFRICFCQPFDGAAPGPGCAVERCDGRAYPRTPDHCVENARVVAVRGTAG
ncbi:hypothetical protein EJ04DRAFT_294180 [Polyplosphaeria fusca]|uniref:Uncharacterized protein n=1 Tax=Polyplosphaeria fusca TaxID=682080 RepID=A0A9P4R617_9PLEO|nr:hypothetical protein EJ04DRAFT_294180 [Polyplosphaeria fusca]